MTNYTVDPTYFSEIDDIAKSGNTELLEQIKETCENEDGELYKQIVQHIEKVVADTL
jgi:hypothetical protein